MKKYLILVFSAALIADATAQQAAKTDTVYLTVYNSGNTFTLKRAPYGEQMPKTDSVNEMVLATDSFTVKDTKVDKTFVPKTNSEIEKLAPSNKTKPDPLVKPTDADMAKIKNNAAKRTCKISERNLKNKFVLIDYDKGCDQTDKCVQAQKAGAAAIIVIFDATKKDDDKLQSEEFDNDLKIPVFAITSKQGDSLRMHLPSRVALYVKKVKTKTQNQNLEAPPVKDIGQNTLNVGKTGAKDAVSKEQALTVQNDSTSFNKQIAVSPNPAKDFINVRYNFDQAQAARVTVINSAGMSVYTNLIGTTNAAGTHMIDTKNWESGVFMIAIDHEGTLLHLQKVVVAH